MTRPSHAADTGKRRTGCEPSTEARGTGRERGDMDRIIVDAKVHFGKPCVAGTRITVQDVLELVDQDLPFDRIIQDYYPDLTAADIHACIRYAIALVGAEDIRLRAAPV